MALPFEKELIRTVALVLAAPLEPEAVRRIVSPSEKPASTKEFPVSVVIVVEVIVKRPDRVVFKATADISRFILLALACMVSVTLPTCINLFAI